MLVLKQPQVHQYNFLASVSCEVQTQKVKLHQKKKKDVHCIITKRGGSTHARAVRCRNTGVNLRFELVLS